MIKHSDLRIIVEKSNDLRDARDLLQDLQGPIWLNQLNISLNKHHFEQSNDPELVVAARNGLLCEVSRRVRKLETELTELGVDLRQ